MQIMCATPQAAAQLLTILYAAHFQVVRDFEIRPILSTVPPITFTMLTTLKRTQRAKIRTLADVEIVGQPAPRFKTPGAIWRRCLLRSQVPEPVARHVLCMIPK
jgi:hypothetical protein